MGRGVMAKRRDSERWQSDNTSDMECIVTGSRNKASAPLISQQKKEEKDAWAVELNG
jgi:hypothetical protein